MKYTTKNSFLQALESKMGKFINYAGLILVVVMTASIIRNINRALSINKEVDKQKAKIAKMEAENERIERELSKAQSPEFVEKEVRNKLGLVKEGETIVVLPDEETLKKLAPQILDEEDTLPDPNYRKWFKLFL